MNEYLRVPFMYSTLLVAVPTGVKFFSWVATMWGGKISTPTPMLFVLGAIVVFLMGGLYWTPERRRFNGPAPDRYVFYRWVISTTQSLAALSSHFSRPSITGSPKQPAGEMNEFWGKVHFWLMTPRSLC